MAGRRLKTSSGIVASTTSTKTIALILAASSSWLEVVEATITWQGTNAAHVPVLCQLVKITADGTSTAVTPRKVLAADADAIRSTAGKNYTVEPTVGDVMDEQVLSPNNGLYIWNQSNIGFIQLKAGEGLAVRVVTPANDNPCVVNFTYIE